MDAGKSDWQDTASSFGGRPYTKSFLVIPVLFHQTSVFFTTEQFGRHVATTIKDPTECAAVVKWGILFVAVVWKRLGDDAYYLAPVLEFERTCLSDGDELSVFLIVGKRRGFSLPFGFVMFLPMTLLHFYTVLVDV